MGAILIGTIIGGILWGVVVNKVIENKGYKENWFWWGFFFGFFALIIALTKQNIKSTTGIIEEKNTKILSGENMIEKVDICSPIHIVSWSIKKDDKCDARLFVDFLNVSEKTVSAVMFSVIGLNSFGDKIFVDNVDSFDIIEQDLILKPGEYGSTHTVLFNSDIRKVEFKVKKICFTDGTIYESNANKWININQSPLHSTYLDCAKRKNSQAEYHSKINPEYWQCVCGFVNTGNECKLCSMQKETALEFSKENIEDAYQKYIKDLEVEKRAQEEQHRLEKKTHIRNRNIVIATLCISILFVIMLYKVIIPDNQYKKAKRMINEGNYVEAVVVLDDILDYKDSMDLKQFSLAKIREDVSDIVPTWHSIIGLKSDGTVLALGNNEHGQCNVQEWKDVVQVFGETGYTIGLKSDGTVLAVGDDLELFERIDVQDWNLIQ